MTKPLIDLAAPSARLWRVASMQLQQRAAGFCHDKNTSCFLKMGVFLMVCLVDKMTSQRSNLDPEPFPE